MCFFVVFFFFNDTATTEIYTLSLHDALPIRVPDLGDEVRAAFAGLVPSTSVVQNPVVLLAQAGSAEYERAISVMAASSAVDALIVIYTPQVGSTPADAADGIRRAAATMQKPLPTL